MMAPDRFADALYATHPLEVVEARILEMLAAAGNEFVPLSVLHDASGLPHGQFYNAWGQILNAPYFSRLVVQRMGRTLRTQKTIRLRLVAISFRILIVSITGG